MENGVHYRTCHLCEAMCGVAIEVNNGKITSIKGDDQDPLSLGHSGSFWHRLAPAWHCIRGRSRSPHSAVPSRRCDCTGRLRAATQSWVAVH